MFLSLCAFNHSEISGNKKQEKYNLNKVKTSLCSTAGFFIGTTNAQ
jgi:hypothetical protein